jgi:hypothetical protein
MSRIVCVGSVPVKPHRKTSRKTAPFGQGILAYRPHSVVAFTAADQAEAVAMFAEAKPAPTTFDSLMSQIKSDLVRCQELGQRQDSLAAMIKAGVKPISGGSPEATRFVPSDQDWDDMYADRFGDDMQYIGAVG